MGALRRLYRGETNINFIGSRKWWYLASTIIILVCIASMVFRGFHWGVEFAGGTQFIAPTKAGVSVQEVSDAITEAGVTVTSAQTVGQNANYLIRTPKLSNEDREAATEAIMDVTGVNKDQIAVSEVSSSWGKEVSKRALYGLGVFLVLVAAYLWIRFERAMAIAAIAALVHDLVLTAGVYSLVGFEVSPATVIGLLTILGFSLYDTVVVFDKVQENSRGLLGSTKYTYPEAANLAVNQTLMRSINTSLIALLPVGALLFVGAGLLGVGTLKDLALVLFVGLATGAYSSMFLATPWLVDIKMLDTRYKLHAQRVAARRAGIDPREARKAAKKGQTTSLSKKPAREVDEDDLDEVESVEDDAPPVKKALAGSGSRSGTRAGSGGGARSGGGSGGGRATPRKRQSGKRR
ncbi:protein translocase subunit SecF [Virgisporangium aurantiacum]|uniref:Protein-export membrane protein SecF n=1 Tax=Virgisporangium aurantiacum TaxID=175570 RepID=A0A8J4E1V1_9ACTN|nr:protein translocase subunit SecF [Virgisporangium aurantiacum]GIJ58198.1 protein-export membrane protein SecF [Virgisporangium aurantiacum]